MAQIPDEHVASNFYFDKNFNSESVKLLPGEYFVTNKDMMLVTVLGSCVAACIRDRCNGIGGMNHFMLPNAGGDSNSLLNASARYGTYAMEILINQLLKLGAQRSNLQAKVFGGGNVIESMIVTDIGQRNADFVLNFLKTEEIKVVAQDLVDIFPRKVYFFPRSGRVMVKKLRNIRNTEISVRENAYKQALNKVNIGGGEIELFS